MRSIATRPAEPRPPPGLDDALAYIREGDTLVVWRLDRLGRSLKHLVETITDLEEKGIGFRSLQESIDTTTSTEKLVFHIFSALAEFERNSIRERTQAGLSRRPGARPERRAAAEAGCGPDRAALPTLRRTGTPCQGDLPAAGDFKADAVRLPRPTGPGAGCQRVLATKISPLLRKPQTWRTTRRGGRTSLGRPLRHNL